MDIWTKLNDEVPVHFRNIIDEFSLNIVKISNIETALVGKNYVILISIDRFYVEIDYISRNSDNKLEKYKCSNFFAEKYDETDRTNLLEGKGAREIIINNLKVINNGLLNKWRNILEGDKRWMEDYKQSDWKMISELRDFELEKIKVYI